MNGSRCKPSSTRIARPLMPFLKSTISRHRYTTGKSFDGRIIRDGHCVQHRGQHTGIDRSGKVHRDIVRQPDAPVAAIHRRRNLGTLKSHRPAPRQHAFFLTSIFFAPYIARASTPGSARISCNALSGRFTGLHLLQPVTLTLCQRRSSCLFHRLGEAA